MVAKCHYWTLKSQNVDFIRVLKTKSDLCFALQILHICTAIQKYPKVEEHFETLDF